MSPALFTHSALSELNISTLTSQSWFHLKSSVLQYKAATMKNFSLLEVCTIHPHTGLLPLQDQHFAAHSLVWSSSLILQLCSSSGTTRLTERQTPKSQQFHSHGVIWSVEVC